MVIFPATLDAVTIVDATPLPSVVSTAGLNDAAPDGDTLPVTCTPCAGCPLEFSAMKLSREANASPVGPLGSSPAIPVTEAAVGPTPVPSPHAARPPNMPARATPTNRPRSFILPPLFGHDAVEYPAVSDHPELLPRHTLLHRRVRLEVMRELGQ